MILANGALLDSSQLEDVLKHLPDALSTTLAGPPLPMQCTLDALVELGHRFTSGFYDPQLALFPAEMISQYKSMAASLLTRESLEFRIRTELGDLLDTPVRTLHPPAAGPQLQVHTLPLGVLLHITAGNADGLPAFSVAEGLLTGNINLVKLPSSDNGLSLAILQALLDIAPALAPYLYVFDVPSSDQETIRRLANLSDAVAVWGGDAAIAGVRQSVPPGVRLIEWGHRLGFAYLSGDVSDTDLEGLAQHLVSTGQLLCSSCQTIFLDTDRMEDLQAFCKRFLPIWDRTASALPPGSSIPAQAARTLQRYTFRLESFLPQTNPTSASQEHRSAFCALFPRKDSALELAPFPGSCLVKRLPRDQILSRLRQQKRLLQTAGLVCPDHLRDSLTTLLLRAGVSRVRTARSMSLYLDGENHDGEYPLRRYLRTADVETSSR